MRSVDSKNTAPHFYLTLAVDMAPLLTLRKTLNEQQERIRLSVNDMIVKAAVGASVRVPEVNASWEQGANGASIRRYDRVNVGIAVAHPHQDKVRVAGHKLQTKLFKGLLEVTQPRVVVLAGLGLVLFV